MSVLYVILSGTDGTNMWNPTGEDGSNSILDLPKTMLSSLPSGGAQTFVAEPQKPYLQGFFLDPNHASSKGVRSLSGLRLLADTTFGDKHTGKKISLVGTDDGDNFWALFGEMNDNTREVSIDFSPKGGPKDIRTTFSDDCAKASPPENECLKFSDGNVWANVNNDVKQNWNKLTPIA